MKKILILFILIFSFTTTNAQEKNNTNNDIFNSIKIYAKNNETENKSKIEIINKGISIEKYIREKVKEKSKVNYSLDIASEKYNNSSESSLSDAIYTSGTNFTDLSVSLKDALAHQWSSINNSYSIYDDNGPDNITIIATAYTSSAEENGGYSGINAMGTSLGKGQVAAPKDIPFNSKIRISGLGVYNVTDRGGAIKRIDKNTIRLDIWHASYSEAMKFGRRVYKGRILPKK